MTNAEQVRRALLLTHLVMAALVVGGGLLILWAVMGGVERVVKLLGR